MTYYDDIVVEWSFLALSTRYGSAVHVRRETAIYFFTGLLIRTFKVTVTSVVNFLITCLVSEILKDKKGKSH